jgi:hypothetical protein
MACAFFSRIWHFVDNRADIRRHDRYNAFQISVYLRDEVDAFLANHQDS